MSIQEKLNAAQNALQTLTLVLPLGEEDTQLIENHQKSLFAQIVAREELTDQQKEEEIDIVMMGIYILAITSPYALCEPGDKTAYYPKNLDEICEITGINDSLDELNVDAETENGLLVLATGTKVMNGELPFEPETFKTVLDEQIERALSCLADNPDAQTRLQLNFTSLKTCLDEIAIKINQSAKHYYTSFILNQTLCTGYPAIEKIFIDALNAASGSNETPDKKKFMDGLVILKRETLANFTEKNSNFDFENCIALAHSALCLAAKVGENKVTRADIEQFRHSTKKYRKYNMTDVLSTALAVIIGAVMGMIVGAAVGFMAGNVPGAIIGGAAGLVTGGGVAGLSFTMWNIKNHPMNKLPSAATEILQNQPAI